MFFFRSERLGALCLSLYDIFARQEFSISFGSKFGDSELYFILKYTSKITTTQCVKQVTCMSWSTEEIGRSIGAVFSTVLLSCRKVVGSIPTQDFSVTLRGFSLSSGNIPLEVEVEDGNGVGGKWQFASV